MNKLENAKKVMEQAHDGQYRWDKRPYSVHPMMVVEILQSFKIADEEVLMAGYLHDVLEDTNYPEALIAQTFGDRVLSLVRELTFEDGDDKTYWNQVSELSETAKLVKLADILANLGDEGKKSQHFIQKRTTALIIILRDLIPEVIYGEKC